MGGDRQMLVRASVRRRRLSQDFKEVQLCTRASAGGVLQAEGRTDVPRWDQQRVGARGAEELELENRWRKGWR